MVGRSKLTKIVYLLFKIFSKLQNFSNCLNRFTKISNSKNLPFPKGQYLEKTKSHIFTER